MGDQGKTYEEIAAGLYDKLHQAKNSTSLLKKHLSPSIFDRLKGLRTKFGGTLADCIRSGKIPQYPVSSSSSLSSPLTVHNCNSYKKDMPKKRGRSHRTMPVAS